MTTLSFDDFRPVTLEDRGFFAEIYARYPQVHSDNTFTNMVCWNHYANYRYAFVDGSVILSSTIGNQTRFRLPIGPRNPVLTRALLDLAFEAGDDKPVNLIDPDSATWLKKICPDLTIVPDRRYFEYIYLASDLANLQGGQYLSIRRQLNRFRKNCAYSVEPVSPGNQAEIKEFLIKWCEWKGCEGGDPVLAHEKEAVFFAVDNLVSLGLRGLVIRVDRKIGALSLFEGLNADTALVHFEKGLPDCEGIYKAVNAEAAAMLAKEYIYINRESDLGVSGLREAKLRYHPHHMVEVYLVQRES